MATAQLSTSPVQRLGRGRWRDWTIGTVAMLLIGLAWQIATPLMAVPDEPAHVIRAAAAAQGEFVGVDSTEARGQISFDVPPGIAQAHELTCFAWDPRVDASCQIDVDDELGPRVTGNTSADINLPTYYVLVGWPSLFLGGEAAMHGMRLVSLLLVSVAVGFAVMQLRMLPRHGWALFGVAASLTPMTGWLAPAVNPNALEWAGALALLATLLALGRTPSPPRILAERAAIVVASTLLLVSGRTITLLWLLLIVVVALIAAHPPRLAALMRRWQTWAAVGASGVIALATFAWAARPPAYDPYVVPVPGMGGTFVEGFRTLWSEAPRYWAEMIGIFSWRDIRAPEIAVAVLGAVILAVIGVGIALARTRLLLAAVVLGAAMLLVPPVVQGALLEEAGYIWQGRYMIAVLGVLLVVAGLAIDEATRPGRLGTRIKALALAAMWAASCWTFAVVLQRFAVGSADGWSKFITSPDWNPLLGTVGTCALFAIALAASYALMLRNAAPARSRPGLAAAQARALAASRSE